MKSKISKEDFKYLEQNPEGDPGFSAEKNRQVIEDTIKKTDRMRRQKKREFEEDLQERTWAATKFMKSDEADPIKFFGKNYAMYLKGKEIIDKLGAVNAKKLQEHTQAKE